MKRLLTTAVLLVLMVTCFAQELSPPKQVTDLGWMVGTWSGSGKISFGGQATAIKTTMTVSFEGQFLKEVAVDDSAGYKLTKTIMTGWQPAKSQFVSYTFTNMAPTARIAHGKMSGNKLVMVAEPWEAEGMTVVGRETMSKISETKFGYKLEFQKGNKWEVGMDIVLAKE